MSNNLNAVGSIGQDCFALPYTMTTESKARQFADALETVFLEDISTEVIDDGGKWFVAVTKGMELANESESVNLIDRIVVLLMSFDLVEYTSNVMPLQACYSRSEAVTVHKALTRRARRQFRIESKLDTLLSRLDAHRDTKAAQDAPAAADAFDEGDSGDKHVLPGKPGAKAKSRK